MPEPARDRCGTRRDDLTDLDRPVEVDSDPATPGTQPFRSDAVGWGGHKWNVDAAGYATHTGAGGS